MYNKNTFFGYSLTLSSSDTISDVSFFDIVSLTVRQASWGKEEAKSLNCFKATSNSLNLTSWKIESQVYFCKKIKNIHKHNKWYILTQETQLTIKCYDKDFKDNKYHPDK